MQRPSTLVLAGPYRFTRRARADLWNAVWDLVNRVTELEEIYTNNYQGQFEIPYNLPAGTIETWAFDCGNEIIWEATITFRSDYVGLQHAIRVDGYRYFVGSSGRSLTSLGYPPQEYLFGTIIVDCYDGNYPEEVWATGYIGTQFPEVSRSGSAYIENGVVYT